MNEITEYWLAHYTDGDLCSLCDNSGRISSVSATGKVKRVNFCICPNGQTTRRRYERAIQKEKIKNE